MDSTPQITSRMALVWMLLTSVSVCSVLSLLKWYGEGMHKFTSYNAAFYENISVAITVANRLS